MKFEPLRFAPPKAERVVLTKGTVVYLLEDHELPLVHVYALVKTGSQYEPEDRVGLAEMTGAVLRTGGTRTLSGDQIDEDLEFMAASASSSIGMQAGEASLTVLTKHFDRAFAMWVDMLRHPVFAEDKVRLYRSHMLEAIRRQNDSPREIARREFRRLVYRHHPFARIPTVASVNNIRRQDLLAFHQKYYHPNNLILGVVGDFNKSELLGKLEKAFQGWDKADIQFPPVLEIKYDWEGSVNYIFKNVPQSSIRLGHLGLKQANPDYYTVVVMNEILGGGSFNRMNTEIRVNRGLVYGVWSFFTTPSRETGMFAVVADTKSKSTGEVVHLMQSITRSMTGGTVSDYELKLAKDAILNSFVFEFTSSTDVVWRQMNLEYDGLPPDYLDRYPENIAKVSKEDVLRVARQYLHPDRFILLVVGNEKEFDKPLSSFGQVTLIPLPEVK